MAALHIDYNPLPAAALFHASPAKNKLAKGGKGSGKSIAMIYEAFMLSMEFAGNRGLLARETMGELDEVIIQPMLDIIPPQLIKIYHKATNKLEFTNGSIIYFRPLDESRKFKGLTLGFFGIDEVDAAKQQDWLQLDGQLRMPGVRHVAMATTNPTAYEHWLYEKFVKSQLPKHEVFTFKTKDNRYLPEDFYNDLYMTMPESWVRRYLEGEWGSISLGDRVFGGFSEKLHTEQKMLYNPSMPVIRGWDFGLTGHAVLFAQRRGNLGIDFLGEVFKKNLTSRQFAQVVARFQEEHFAGAVYEDYGDIAGLHRDATSGRSPIEEIGDELKMRILTSAIPLVDSLDLVRVKLSQAFDGSMAMRFSPDMRLTIEGLNGGYVFKKDRQGNVVSDVPASDPIFEHLMDAMRYLIWHVFAYARPEKQKFELPKVSFEDVYGFSQD